MFIFKDTEPSPVTGAGPGQDTRVRGRTHSQVDGDRAMPKFTDVGDDDRWSVVENLLVCMEAMAARRMFCLQ